MYNEDFFCNEASEALEHVTQRNCECPIFDKIWGQAKWSFEQPDLVNDVPAHHSVILRMCDSTFQ